MGRQKKATPKSFQVKISTQALGNIDEITGYIAFINGRPAMPSESGMKFSKPSTG
jgi:hypothetical protein